MHVAKRLLYVNFRSCVVGQCVFNVNVENLFASKEVEIDGDASKLKVHYLKKVIEYQTVTYAMDYSNT